MKLRALRLWNVRRFGGRGIAIEDIGDGVNVLSAGNEHGKSTCFDALHALFFQPHSSTSTAVRLLRPYSGGSPQIQADIETPESRFRIDKQYYSGKRAFVTDIGTGRLVAQADEAEAWIGNLVRGGTSGPAGLLWVQQGTTEIGTGTAREKEDDREAREDVLTSVAGEVEALTGGRRMVQAMARCEADLDRLVTATGRPKAGGPYAHAIEQRDQLREYEQVLKGHLDALRVALDERRTKTARLKELNDPDAAAARRMEKERTAKALEQARSHADKLEAAESAALLESARLQTATEVLRRYNDCLARAAALAEEVKAKEQAANEAKRARNAAAESDATVSAALEAAEAEAEAARTLLSRAQAAHRAAEATRQLTELTERLNKAEEARREVERLGAEQAALAMPEEIVERLEILEQDIAVMRASAKAVAVTVMIAYAENREGSVLRDGVPLSGGEPQSVTATTRLDITDVGVLTVSPGAVGAQDSTHIALSDAEDERQRLLARTGVETLAIARERQRQAGEKATARRASKAALAALAPDGIEALRTLVAQLQTQSSDVQSDVPDAAEAEESHQRVLAGLSDARTRREIARSRLAATNEAFVRVDSAAAAARIARARAEEALGPPEGRKPERDKLAADAEEAARRWGDAVKPVETLRSQAPDLESIEAASARAATAVERIRTEAVALEREISKLTGRITAHTDDAVEEAFEEEKGRREAAETRVAACEAEVAALSRLKRALEEARGAAKEQYFGPVMEELKPLLSLLLDEASITFDEETLLPQSLARNGQDEEIDFLSSGMREQLAILTRLAFARLLAKGEHPVPVILDDALAYCDDDRIERMFDALHCQARDLQIVVFTCRQRAFERLGGRGLRMIDWRP